MKILTTNFLTCAVKSCKSKSTNISSSSTATSPYPLHFRDATLSRTPINFQPLFIRNILPRIDYDALLVTATELSLQAMVPAQEVVENIISRRSPNTTAESKAPATVGEDSEEDAEMQEDDSSNPEPKPEQQATLDTEQETTEQEEQAGLKKLHTLLLETSVQEGKLVCGNCGFEYPIKEGVANFLLPAHLV